MARSAMENDGEIHRGLIGVNLDRSRICSIDGAVGELRYAGYSIHDLASLSTFEETAYLLLNGELPGREDLDAFDAWLKAERNLPAAVVNLVRTISGAHPMEVLRTSVSALSTFEPEAMASGRPPTIAQGVRLISQIPTIVAAHHRIRQGHEPIQPSSELGHAANLLYMLHGVEPSAMAAALIDTDLLLHAEHGSNASTFAARVVISTKADLYGALTAAIAALAGPSHGGAAENVVAMVKDIGGPDNAREYVSAKRRSREPVMGFGHRVYRTEDPRVRHLREGVRSLSTSLGEHRWFETLEAVVEAMSPYGRHGVHVNVDFYSGVLYEMLGIPSQLFVPLFAIGRSPGWIAHAMEQYTNNILIRPLLVYDGAEPRQYVPVGERGPNV
jgi:citrate synthase